MMRTPNTRLNRDMLTQGLVNQLAQKRDGTKSTVLSAAELKTSRQQFLPDDYNGPDIWVFGYGSLIWNPLIDYKTRLYGQLYGYHRRFCLWTHIGRGSPECPGLVLALDRGGSVRGCVYRIAAQNAAQELDILWTREMINGSYHPKWLSVKTETGAVRALCFTMRRDSPAYAPKMSDEETSRIIATATGFVGPCRHYLFETVEALAVHNMPDAKMARLARLVKATQHQH